MEKLCYIVAAGEGFVPFTPGEDDLVIAADGGYRYLSEHGIRCDLFVGDGDSEGTFPTDVSAERHATRKDETDTALAVEAGRARGYRRFVILAGFGGREDHTFANLTLLYRYRKAGLDVHLYSETQDVFCLYEESRAFRMPVGGGISFFAVGGNAEGVRYKGLSYPLTDATLTPDCPLGVSNFAVAERVTVRVGKGALLCFLSCPTLSELPFADAEATV